MTTDKMYKFVIAFCIVFLTVLLVIACVRLQNDAGAENTTTETSNASYETTSATVPAVVTLGLTMTEVKHVEEKKIVPELVVEPVEEDLEAEPVEVEEGEPEVVVNPLVANADPVSSEELELLACVIYQEAGGDKCCDDCRRRVADVVLNRMADDRYPSTMHDVLTQESQYGRYYWTGVVWPERTGNEAEENAIARAYRIAGEVLSGQHSELYGNGYIFQAEFIQGYDRVYCEQCDIYFGKG